MLTAAAVGGLAALHQPNGLAVGVVVLAERRAASDAHGGVAGEEIEYLVAIDAAGWMHTGDLATIDAAGYCNIVGRIKDMVIRGGENVYPREIEEFLYGHPKIADVQIIGVPDGQYGEDLCAWVKLRAGTAARRQGGTAASEGEIREFC